MSALDDIKRRLRDRSEHYLMLASVKELGSGVPGTVKPYRERGGVLWRCCSSRSTGACRGR